MSAPFYTSEKLESDNPKWADIEISQANGAANGVVIRLWCHAGEGLERVVTVWGVYFSGLHYLGPRLSSVDPLLFQPNTLVLHMQGGYFTASHCFKELRPPDPRAASVYMDPSCLRPSYSVSVLLRLHSTQQAIKQHSVAAASLRERISDGGLSLGPEKEEKENPMLRRLLHRTKPPSHPHHQLAAVKREVEEVRFRVNLLSHERDKKRSQLRQKISDKSKLAEENKDKEIYLMEKYQTLHGDVEKLRDLRRLYIDAKENLFSVGTTLQALRRKRITELNIIYPISQPPPPPTTSPTVDQLCAERKYHPLPSPYYLNAFLLDPWLELDHQFVSSEGREWFSGLCSPSESTLIDEDKFAICGVHLPNSEDFAGYNEVQVSVALGFVAHLVQMIAYFLHIPPRYPILHAGSRSKVIDHIAEKIPDKEREFPLYSKGKDKLQFNYGVYLLNKNIAQLRWYCNLTTSDLRTTLPNILALLNLKPSHNIAGLESTKRPLSSSTTELQVMRGSRLRGLTLLSPLSYSLDKGLDQLDSRPVPVPRQRSITHNSSELAEVIASSEDDGQREFLHSWASQGNAPNFSDIEVESDRSQRQSPAPEESLASIINKINSPAIHRPNSYVNRSIRSESGGENDFNGSFVRQSIRQVTSRHVSRDS